MFCFIEPKFTKFIYFSVSHKAFLKSQPLTEYIKNEMCCDLQSEMDIKSLNSLGMYVTGLKVNFMLPDQPNSKRRYKVVGLLDSPNKFRLEQIYKCMYIVYKKLDYSKFREFS